MLPLPRKPKPAWLRTRLPGDSPQERQVSATLRQQGLATVCQEARCPNRGECWQQGEAAFLILGSICTRNCRFCHIPVGRPAPPDPDEPGRLANAALTLGLRHVVITSVSRDDLPDGGAAQFIACIRALRARSDQIAIEVLTPDFRGKLGALEAILAAGPSIFNHNLETVARLYPQVRPAADYRHSLAILAQAAAFGGIPIKSGIMLGLGESREEVSIALNDLRQAGVRWLTIGQYLQPSLEQLPVIRYWPPEAFAELEQEALAMGFTRVISHPLARSSLHAGHNIKRIPVK